MAESLRAENWLITNELHGAAVVSGDIVFIATNAEYGLYSVEYW